MKNVILLVMLVLVGACRDEVVDRVDGGFSKSPAPQVIYRDRDSHHDESALNTYFQWRMMDTLFGGSRDSHRETVVHHETVIHHVPAPTPTPSKASSTSGWWSSKPAATRNAVQPSGTVTHSTAAPTHATSPSVGPPKSSSYGFKAPSRPVTTTYRPMPSRPVTFRSSTSIGGRR